MRSVREFCCPQEIIVAGRAYLDAVHPVGMHQNVVEIPEIDVRQVYGDDLLDFIVDDFAFLLVDGAAAIADQLIHARVGVEGAVGALWSEAVRTEDMLENVGIEVAPNPAQGMELVRAFGDVGEERGKFKAADVELDASLSQLLL